MAGGEDVLKKKLGQAYLAMVDGAEPHQFDLGKLIQGLAILVAGISTGPLGAAAAAAAGAASEMVDLRSASLGGGGRWGPTTRWRRGWAN